MKILAHVAVLIALATATVTAADYCKICKDHTMCLYQWYGKNCSQRVSWGVKSSKVQQFIVDKHNELRRKVAKGMEKRGAPGPQPSASNMQMLAWDNELAKVAQRWADQCNFWHDKCRNVDRFSWAGQNLYISASWRSDGVQTDDTQDWDRALMAFYNETAVFNNKNVDKFNAYPSKGDVGHYTQLVWATTSLVGCGYMSFVQEEGGKKWFKKYYACNYGPGGNIQGAKIYKTGKPCSDCPSTAPRCYQGLCAPRQSLLSTLTTWARRIFG